MNIRSFFNIANGLEPDRYSGESLRRVDRFAYLRNQIQLQARSLEDTLDYLSQHRADFNNEAQGELEMLPIKLFRLSDSRHQVVNEYEVPYRIAINTFLNNILSLNISNRTALKT